MKLASHNSFTYLPVRKWWMKPLAFTAKCQRSNIIMQYYLGARMFDLRIRFEKSGRPILCHGLMEYELEPACLNAFYEFWNQKKDCYVRVVLELSEHDAKQEARFRSYCMWLEETYLDINFFGGNNRTDWLCEHPIYEFTTPMQEIDNRYASSTSRFDSDSKILQYIDDLYPLDYAKRYNHEIISKGTTFQWLMLDFIDIQ